MEQKNVVFHFDRIYLKDVSFESPRSPTIFLESDYDPKIDVQLQISHQTLDQKRGVFEVVLKAKIQAATNAETAFLVEVQQAGTFTITGLSEQDLEKVLEATCPSALFPFLREQVNRLVTEGGFPAMLLQPVNFEAMYEQKAPPEDSADGGLSH